MLQLSLQNTQSCRRNKDLLPCTDVWRHSWGMLPQRLAWHRDLGLRLSLSTVHFTFFQDCSNGLRLEPALLPAGGLLLLALVLHVARGGLFYFRGTPACRTGARLGTFATTPVLGLRARVSATRQVRILPAPAVLIVPVLLITVMVPWPAATTTSKFVSPNCANP